MNDEDDRVWRYFQWSTERLPPLILKLDSILRAGYEEYTDGPTSDDDDRARTASWAGEFASILTRWSSVLEISRESISVYHNTFRRNRGRNSWNSETQLEIDGVAQEIFTLAAIRSGGDSQIFRPYCLERANEELMSWLRRHPEDVDHVHHRTFEAIVAEVISSQGWKVELTKRTRDGGYDIMCIKNDSLGFPVIMIVETKLYDLDRPVGLPMVDRLMGVASRVIPTKAMLVTNSRFSGTVWKEWEVRVGRDLELVDREELIRWLREYTSPITVPD